MKHTFRCHKKLASIILTILSVFFILSGEFRIKAYAADSSIISMQQVYNNYYSSVGALSQEQFINELAPIKYLTVSLANCEAHFYCNYCGVVSRNSTTSTVYVYGYRKDNGNAETLAAYSVSGLDGSSRRSASYQMMVTDAMKETYAYIKVSASISGMSIYKCEHSMDEPMMGYYSNGSGYIYVVASSYDEPVFQSGGNLADVTLSEGVPDYVGIVNGYFPSGVESYTWQYLDEGTWISLKDGVGSYNTSKYGTIELCDKTGGAQFSSSNMLKLKNPETKMSGVKFRVILNSGNSASNTMSNEAAVTVNSRNVSGFYSARFASRFGEVGEKLTLSDIISYIKFDNGQIVETQRLLDTDSKRVSFYGFIKPSDNSKNAEMILEGLRDGSISYTELEDDSEYLDISGGENTYFVKFSYKGKDSKEIFAFITFTGKDETPPVFDENVELYEKDGMTLYVRGNYAISDEDISDTLRIYGYVSDSISDISKIRWAYTLTDTKNAEDEVKIPVYRMGNEIDVSVSKNGKYILYAEDGEGNTAQKTFVVKAFDENEPKITCNVTGISDNPDSGIYSSYRIDAQATDEEKLDLKPYVYKYCSSENDAKAYNPASALETDFVSTNSFLVSRPGYYVVAAKDAVGKMTKCMVTIPDKTGSVIDSTSPEIVMTPVSVKDSSGALSEYNISIIDNYKLKQFRIELAGGEVVKEINHSHSSCKAGSCSESYHFIPTKAGNYKITAIDYAGNKSTASFVVSERKIESVEITDLSESMSVNSEILLKSLVDGSRILLKMSDGTNDIYSGNSNIKIKLIDSNDLSVEKIVIGYGENRVRLVAIIDEGTEKERNLEFEKIVIGEDNVAPLPGNMSSEMTDGWDGSLTNDASKQITLRAADYADDGSDTDKLVITWYRNDEEVQKKTVSDGGDTYGPFSGEDSNGTYRYTVTDENGNTGFSTFEKVIDCWDMTPPTGEIKLLPDGVSEDSKARFKQIQIVNAADDRGLAQKPYSFKGKDDGNYTIISSVVAGDNSSYEIYLKDSAGNVAHLGDLNLTGIDSVAPTINGYEISDGENGKKILHIDATDSNSAGEDTTSNLSYSIDGENYQESPDFEIEESGSYTLYVKDDTGNITKTSTDYTDADAPEVSVTQDESGAGVLIVTVSDNTGLSRVVMEGPDGIREILQVYDGASEDTIRKEIGKIGDYKITVTDMSGNTKSADITVSSIAAACSSSILTGLKIAPAGWTNGDVTVIAQLTDTQGLSQAPFKWNNSIYTAQPYMIMTNNGDSTVEICDRYGNSIATQTITVNNIDRISPVIFELKQSDDKNHLIIKASDNGSGLYQITIAGGPYTVETGAITLDGETSTDEIQLTLPTSGTYTVRAYDRAGNSSQKQISVEGVTTDIVQKEYIEIEKIVEKPVEKIVTEEKVVTNIQTVTQTVEKPVPILVPVPTTETVIKYKTLKEKGEDTSVIVKGDDIYSSGEDTVINGEDKDRIEKETLENEEIYEKNKESGITGKYTKDGTYIGPDGYEYFGRVDPNLKKDHPFKYWFKKNAEKIAIAACILALIFLILCIVMGIMLTKDYFKEQKDKRDMDKLKNRT